MGIRIIKGRELGDELERACFVLFCSVEGMAFGPVFESSEEAESFILFVVQRSGKDPRALTRQLLTVYHSAWLSNQVQGGPNETSNHGGVPRD